MSLLVATALLNASWSHSHQPDRRDVLAALGPPPRRTRPRPIDTPTSAVDEAHSHRARTPADRDLPSNSTPDREPGADDPSTEDDLNPEAAQRFVDIALGGGFGNHYQHAAELGVALAAEHGFGDDPLRVAEAVVIFVDPCHR